MITLAVLLAERVGLIIILAFCLVNVPRFRRLLFQDTLGAKTQLILIFGAFGLLANWTGIAITPGNQLQLQTFLWKIPASYSIVNIRILAVSVAGMVGGPLVGAMTGLITGIGRLYQANFAIKTFFYVPSSLVIGFASGFFDQRNRNRFALVEPLNGFLIGLMLESVQMVCVALFSPGGLSLARFIALPMILVSAAGTALFLAIIRTYFRQEEATQIMQTRSVLQLANETLPYFRQGFDRTVARRVARVLADYTSFDAICITDQREVLAFVGPGSDHHLAGGAPLGGLIRGALASGQVTVAHSRQEVACPVAGCPLAAAVVVPLVVKGAPSGTFTAYYCDRTRLNPVAIQLATGLGEILATQVMLGEAEKQTSLLRDAELKSLQAQVNPHFFFNAINTISAMIRRDPEQGRELLLQLATYFRASLVGARKTQITLAQEERQVRAYLALEQTRFPDKYQFTLASRVPEDVLLPPFTIQVLVENCIRHAFGPRPRNNQIRVHLAQVGEQLVLTVTDNGQGIPPDQVARLGHEEVASLHGSGTALQNLAQRLTSLYGPQGTLTVTSQPGRTRVTVTWPYHTQGGMN